VLRTIDPFECPLVGLRIGGVFSQQAEEDRKDYVLALERRDKKNRRGPQLLPGSGGAWGHVPLRVVGAEVRPYDEHLHLVGSRIAQPKYTHTHSAQSINTPDHVCFLVRCYAGHDTVDRRGGMEGSFVEVDMVDFLRSKYT
jgi:hypothetical protein